MNKQNKIQNLYSILMTMFNIKSKITRYTKTQEYDSFAREKEHQWRKLKTQMLELVEKDLNNSAIAVMIMLKD